MHLEKHAKALLNYPSSSEEDDLPKHYDAYQATLHYKRKYEKYRLDLRITKELLEAYKQENAEDKKYIAQLVLEVDDYKHRQQFLEEELIEQSQLTKSAMDQLTKQKTVSLEEKLLLEQKMFEQKLTAQSTDALEKMKIHFDQQLQQLATPKATQKVASKTTPGKPSPAKAKKKK